MNEERASLINFARVMLAESRARNRSRVNLEFRWTLLRMAQNARRRAAMIPRAPVQKELF